MSKSVNKGLSGVRPNEGWPFVRSWLNYHTCPCRRHVPPTKTFPLHPDDGLTHTQVLGVFTWPLRLLFLFFFFFNGNHSVNEVELPNVAILFKEDRSLDTKQHTTKSQITHFFLFAVKPPRMAQLTADRIVFMSGRDGAVSQTIYRKHLSRHNFVRLSVHTILIFLLLRSCNTTNTER